MLAITGHDVWRLPQRFEVMDCNGLGTRAVLAQDDPKKNTAVLASKRGDMKLHKAVRTLPKKASSLNRSVGRSSALRITNFSPSNEVPLWVLTAVGPTLNPQ